MKSVAFLRNTWRKREPKAPDCPASPSPSQISQLSRSSPAPGRPLAVVVKNLPIGQPSAPSVEGSWRPAEPYQPPSPIYNQFTQQRSDRFPVRRGTSQVDLKAAYGAHEDFLSGMAASPRTSPFPPSRPRSPPDDAHYLPSTQSVHSPKLPSGLLSPSHRKSPSSRQLSSQNQESLPASPSLPSFKLLPPLDLNYGPGGKLDSLLEGKTCKCVPPTHSKNPALCPRNKSPDPQPSMTTTRISAGTRHSPKPVNAGLELAHGAKRRSLYHSTGSTPHLPYREHVQSFANSDSSTYSVDSSEAEQFPLSLFPLPPPLIVRKKVPAPLVLRSTFTSSASAQSSRDSSPVRTPTTPRFQTLNSPSQSNIISPTKKCLGRPSASFSPPPFSPPNSPLPKPPISREVGLNLTHPSVRPLRMAQSNLNLRDPLPFPATHRLTSSEPISDQSNLPPKRPPKWRPAERPKNIQAYLQDMKEQTTDPGLDAHIEWGYAF